jgi:hypothetical protein
MMMPCVPFADLIIRHAALAFCILEGPFQ